MSFVYGTALLLAAVLLLGFARYAVTRFESSSWVREFAATEVMALLITCLSAFGLALLVGGAVAAQSGGGLTGLGVSLAVVALAVVGVMRVFRSAKPPARAVTPKPAGRATT